MDAPPAGKPGPQHADAPRRPHLLDPSLPPPLAARDWLVCTFATDTDLDLSGVLLVTPGARASRVMVALLAEAAQRAGLALWPPATTTAGRLAEALAPAARPAGGIARRRAWQRAMEAAPPEAIQRIAPAADRPTAWADEVARAADELASGGLRFADAADGDLPPQEEPELWRALAGVQRRYEDLLGQAGLEDPALAALDVARRGADPSQSSDTPRDIVLLACTDLSPVARTLLESSPARVRVLATVPAMHVEGLDDDGCVREAYWAEADIAVDADACVAGGAALAQARLAVRAAMDAGTSTIGLADEALAGAVRRAAAEHGLTVHEAAGSSLAQAGPARLLAAIRRLMVDRRYADLDALLRMPAVERAVGIDAGDAMLARSLDVYAAAALPTHAHGPLPAGPEHPRVRGARRTVRIARRRLWRMLAPLFGRRRLADWAEPVSAVLADLLEPSEGELGPLSRACAEAAGRALRELSSLDGEPVRAAEAVDLVLHALAGERAAIEPGGEDLDLLGWLELPLDPSDKVVLAGAHARVLPARATPGAFLGEGLRRALGLPGEGRRLARDAAAMAALSAAGRLRVVLGSRDARGEPVLPSPLLLRGPDSSPMDVLAAARAAIEPPPVTRPPGACRFRVGRLEDAAPPRSLAVTSFRTYIQSPYLFYLKYVARLRAVEPLAAAIRMDGARFGSLVHEALRRFSADAETREDADAGRIRRVLYAHLWEAAEAQFGRHPPPLVLAQIDAAEKRLSEFASIEAARRTAGWRTIAAEWSPPRPVPLASTGMLVHGTIDRIDLHEREGLALLDYKTAAKEKTPERVHRTRGAWVDLQLPLYALLAQQLADEHGVPSAAALGFVALSSERSGVHIADWDADDLAGAQALAAEIAARVRDGVFAERGRWPFKDDPLAPLAGVGLLLDAEHDELATAEGPA
ncbi:MAG: PD-(D/E)XK nuclease family protein [Planctomycetota bacterium]